MTAPALSTTSSGRECIARGWQLCSTAPGRFQHPAELDALSPDAWVSAASAGPVAELLRDAGRWRLDGPEQRFDEHDWWYRADFELAPADAAQDIWLGFDGLATVADVWLNGELLLQSSSMFIAHERCITPLLRDAGNRLVLHFKSLDAVLAQKRPRPRWRAPMVAHQQLRWLRTTLLGRTPGWSPPAAVVGPWKDVWLERRGQPAPKLLKLHATVSPDGVGSVDVACSAPGLSNARIELEVERDGQVHRVLLSRSDDAVCTGRLSIPGVSLWWPHTHGEPARYAARLRVTREGVPAQVSDSRHIGFRRLDVDQEGGRFNIDVNGVRVFCRGACWTPLDIVRLRASPEATRAAIAQARAAGMNMLRVGGTMVYEDAAFFEACDELGVLVWQEFMFANMDYPAQDAHFIANVRAEFEQQAALWQGRASLAVLCGNSEGEQQAAMWGAPPESWSPPFFHETLKGWVREALPGVPYWPSSAHGGDFPHQAACGTTSYYGVGAYLRPLDDARRSDLSFATECLAFANVPDAATIDRMPGGQALRVLHPEWKRRTPHDLNAGWDFEDVRDHYLKLLFDVEPLSLRSTDHERYLALSRVVTGEVMAQAFAEWRRPGSRCGGALVWFLRDLWAGAGWGLLDDEGRPKACYHAIRRVLQPRAVLITDEGVNGLSAHVVNETAQALRGTLAVRLYGAGGAAVGTADHALAVAPRGGVTLGLAAGLAGFTDLSYAYRFGPPPVLLVHASLVDDTGRTLGDAFHFPAGRPHDVHDDIGLTARFDAEAHTLHLATRRFAQHVHIDLGGFAPADNDFHLAPGAERSVEMRRMGAPGAAAPHGTVWALNAARPVSFSVQS